MANTPHESWEKCLIILISSSGQLDTKKFNGHLNLLSVKHKGNEKKH